MLGPEELADVEGDMAYFLSALHAQEGTPIEDLCQAATGYAPELGTLGSEGAWRQGRIITRPGLSSARRKFVRAHELAHLYYESVSYRNADLEERCDAGAAILCMPRGDVRRALGHLGGHRVYALAERFGVTQSVALLRIGEVTGRPVMLLRPLAPIVRGVPFEWPSTSALRRALEEGRSEVHPLRIRDEVDKWGLMARG